MRTSDEHRRPEKTQTTSPQCLATEIMAWQVRADLIRSSRLRSEKNSSLGRDFFLDFFLYRTLQDFTVGDDSGVLSAPALQTPRVLNASRVICCLFCFALS